MGTRSRIGIQLADESILSVYCHWDGYPEFNGVKLVEHFNSRDAAAELIDGGDISALWTNLVGITKLFLKLDHFITLLGAKIVLLVLMLTSMITLLMVKSMPTSLRMVSGCAIIVISLKTIVCPKW
jgi:hypothetical protein